MKKYLLLFVLTVAVARCALAQADSSLQSPPAITGKMLDAIQAKYARLSAALQKQSLSQLKRMQRKEARITEQLAKKDSSVPAASSPGALRQYQQLQARLKDTTTIIQHFPLKQYIPHLDSMQSALRFLQFTPGLQSLDPGRLQSTSQQLLKVQDQLQQANNIQSFIRQRRDQLKAELEQMGMAKQLNGLNKEVYYYQQRLSNVKATLNDKQKMEEQALAALRKVPAFTSFMQKNSYLAQLFPTPAGYGTDQALAGLQTRTQVQSLLTQRVGVSTLPVAGNGGGVVDEQVQQAQQQLTTLKDKAASLNIHSAGSDMEMPAFAPNNQKTKSLFQRLEYGFNIQSTGTSQLLPATTDLGLSLGYKLSDGATIGVGASYKQGWGKLFNHIRLSSEGMGVRSFIDIKAKGSIWITGGYELNYLDGLSQLAAVSNAQIWQKSALAGLTKKYRIGKKEGKLQLLWDFLSYSQVPQSPALKFRLGYSL